MSPTEQDQSIADVCDAAADVIERDGWCQGELWKDQYPGGKAYSIGPVCMVGAIGVVTGHITVGVKASNVDAALPCHPAVVAVAEQMGYPSTQATAFNDGSADAETVVQALRDTATKHRPDAMQGEGS